jgi:imidazolonepropionase-like amidohydrolase
MLIAAACLALPAIAPAADLLPQLALVGGEVHTMEGRVLPEATVLVADGKIQAVRRGRRTPRGYEVIDAAGMRIYPGFVAAAAEGLGVPRFRSGKEKALHIRVSHSLDPHARALALASSHGITTAFVSLYQSEDDPQTPFLGTGSVIRVLPGGDPEEMVLAEPAGLHVQVEGAAHRAALRRAVTGARGEAEEKDDPGKKLLRRVARGQVPLLVTGGRRGLDATGVLRAVELAGSLEVALILDRPVEAWTVADRLAAAQVPVVQNVRSGRGKPRPDERSEIEGGWRFDAPAVLAGAGVLTAVAPTQASVSWRGTPGRDLMNLAMEAAFAVRGGMTSEEAMRAITIDAARILGLEDRIGSIKRGKDADLVVVDGDPLHYRSFVRWTVAGGRIAYDASESPYWGKILERRDRTLQSSPDWPDRER